MTKPFLGNDLDSNVQRFCNILTKQDGLNPFELGFLLKDEMDVLDDFNMDGVQLFLELGMAREGQKDGTFLSGWEYWVPCRKWPGDNGKKN